MLRKPKILVVVSFNMDLIASTGRVPNSGETVIGMKFRTAPGGKGINFDDVEAVAKKFRTRGVENLIITMGGNGSVAADKDGIEHTSCVKMPEVADPTAAGDSFVGSFCTGLTAGLSKKNALAFASHAAAITVSRMGAITSLPTVNEVQNLLRERNFQGFPLKCQLIHDHFQNFRSYGLPKAQLIIANAPYNISGDFYASRPSWWKDGRIENGASSVAGKTAFTSARFHQITARNGICSTAGYSNWGAAATMS